MLRHSRFSPFAAKLASLAVLVGLFLTIVGVGPSAHAQAKFPNQQIRIVVPYPAGGLADILARRIAEKARTELKQPVIVVNMPGGGGNVGAQHVAQAPADGYTLLLASQFVYSVSDLLYDNLRYDPRAFQPVSALAIYPTLILGSPSVPVNSMAELIDYARKNPGKLNYASQGNGQIGHLTMEMLKKMANIDLVHVPYRGSAPALNELMGGQVDIYAETMLGVMPMVQAKKVKVFGVTGPKRMDLLKDVPAVTELVPGFLSEAWLGLAAPKGTPAQNVKLISDAVVRALNEPDLRAWIQSSSAEVLATTPDRMEAMVNSSRNYWAPVIKSAHIKAD
jgi:tripartite-type tricarboxylate transporter receptor subunit TctC